MVRTRTETRGIPHNGACTMKALVRVPGGAGVELTEQPDPRPGPGEVVVAVHSCGICGSDVHAAEAGVMRPGSIPGHELSGTIAELGGHVRDWRIGQPVAVNPLGSCGECEWCSREMPIQCRGRPNLGLSAPGGFAEFIAVPAAQLVAWPEDVPLEHGSRAEPMAVAVRAVREAAPAAGDNALVYGVGPIGLHVIVALRAARAGCIVAVGRSSAGRRAAASGVGADVVVDSRETDVAEYLAGAGIQVHQAYECAGTPNALLACMRALRPGGAIVGVALGRELSEFDSHLFVARGMRMVSACAYGEADFRHASELVIAHGTEIESLISDRVPLDAAPEAFIRLRTPGDLVAVLVQPWR